MRLIRTLFLLVCFLLPSTMAPRGADDQVLADDPRVMDAVRVWEAWVEYQAAINVVPALSIALVHDQEILATNAFGWANKEAGRPVATDTVYSICSISKLFTSLAVMQLRDAGKLRLDDPVAEHLDWFNIKDVHPRDRPITVRGLLTHSAGLPRESDYPYWNRPDFRFPTHEEIVARLGDQSTLYPASRYFQYSNLGLTLAGEIVAAVSGDSFDAYIQTRILDPLGMESTFTEIPGELRGERLALGHSARRRDGSRQVLPLFQVRGIAPAAGFASNVEDLATFAMWQFRLLGDNTDTVLEGSTLREMQQPQWVDPDWETTRGLGFNVQRRGEHTYVGHGGGCPGYYSYFMLEPKTRIGAIVLSSSIGTETSFYAREAIEILRPAIAQALKEPDKRPERDAGLGRYVGIYDSAWGQSAVLRWKDGLAELWLGSRDPDQDMEVLRESGENSFRRVRDDDKDVLGETYTFEVDSSGTVQRYKQHSFWMVKVR